MNTNPVTDTTQQPAPAPRRRLALRRETLRELTTVDLRHIAGGKTTHTNSDRCG